MKRAALITSLMLLPFATHAGVCTLFGGDGCANGNYYGYNTHKAHVEGMKYHRTGINGYGINHGYPWYGDWKGYYPDYAVDPKKRENMPTAVRPVFTFPAGNFYAPPQLDYFIEIRPIKTEPTSLIDVRDSHAQTEYAPRMMRGGPMGEFRCVNNLCAPVYTKEQLQMISGQKRIFANPIEDGAVFESIYQIIGERYIKPISVEELAVAGLSNIYEDVGIRVNETENSVSLTRNGIAVRTFENKPYKEDIIGWSDLTYKVIDTLAHQSMKFGLQTHSEVIKKFFEGISAHLDDASKYITPDTTKNNRINNRKIDAMLYSIKHNDKGAAFDSTKPVTVRVNEKKQVVLTIRSFEANTPLAVKSFLSAYLEGIYNKQFGGLLIDLRDNKGGLVGSAIDTADLFLEKGKTIAMTKGRHRDSERLYESTEGDILKGAKIVILVNNKTASSAELFTAALHDNERAAVIGKKTYGKGSVQTSIALDDGAEISFTWAYIYTPDGNILDKNGVNPDEVLKCNDFSIPAYAARLFDTVTIKKAEPPVDNVSVEESEYKEGADTSKTEEGGSEAEDNTVDTDKNDAVVENSPVTVDESKNNSSESQVKTDDVQTKDKDEDRSLLNEVKGNTESNVVETSIPDAKADDADNSENKSDAKTAAPEINADDVKSDKKVDLTDSTTTDFNELLKNTPVAEPENNISSQKAIDWFSSVDGSVAGQPQTELEVKKEEVKSEEKKAEELKSEEKKLGETKMDDMPSSPLDLVGGEKDDKAKASSQPSVETKTEEKTSGDTKEIVPLLF